MLVKVPQIIVINFGTVLIFQSLLKIHIWRKFLFIFYLAVKNYGICFV